jgi:hypothetical protein
MISLTLAMAVGLRVRAFFSPVGGADGVAVRGVEQDILFS